MCIFSTKIIVYYNEHNSKNARDDGLLSLGKSQVKNPHSNFIVIQLSSQSTFKRLFN